MWASTYGIELVELVAELLVGGAHFERLKFVLSAESKVACTARADTCCAGAVKKAGVRWLFTLLCRPPKIEPKE